MAEIKDSENDKKAAEEQQILDDLTVLANVQTPDLTARLYGTAQAQVQDTGLGNLANIHQGSDSRIGVSTSAGSFVGSVMDTRVQIAGGDGAVPDIELARLDPSTPMDLEAPIPLDARGINFTTDASTGSREATLMTTRDPEFASRVEVGGRDDGTVPVDAGAAVGVSDAVQNVADVVAEVTTPAEAIPVVEPTTSDTGTNTDTNPGTGTGGTPTTGENPGTGTGGTGGGSTTVTVTVPADLVYKTVQETYTELETRIETYTTTETRTETYTEMETRTETYTVQEPRTETYTEMETRTETYTVQEPRTETYTEIETRTETYTVQEPRTETYTEMETRQETYTVQEPRTETYTEMETRTETYTVKEPRTETYTVMETRTEEYTTTEIQQETYTVMETRQEMYTTTEQQTVTVPRDYSYESGGRNANNLNINSVKDALEAANGKNHEDGDLVFKNINNSSFNLNGSSNDVFVVEQNCQNANINLGGGNNVMIFEENPGKNVNVNAGSGKDVLMLPGDMQDYSFKGLNNNNGVFSGQITGPNNMSITINNFDAIKFGDGNVMGDSSLVMETKTIEVEVEHTRDIQVPVEYTRDVEVEVTHTREVEVPVEYTREVMVEVEHTREVTEEVEKTREVLVDVEYTREVQVPVEHTRVVMVDVEYTREVQVPVERTREVMVDVEYTREVEVPVEHTREVMVDVEYTREVQVPVEHTREVTEEVEHTREVQVEVEKTRDVQVIDTDAMQAAGAYQNANGEWVIDREVEATANDNITGGVKPMVDVDETNDLFTFSFNGPDTNNWTAQVGDNFDALPVAGQEVGWTDIDFNAPQHTDVGTFDMNDVQHNQGFDDTQTIGFDSLDRVW